MAEDFKNAIKYFLQIKELGGYSEGMGWNMYNTGSTLYVCYKDRCVFMVNNYGAWGADPNGYYFECPMGEYFENIYQPTTSEIILYSTLFPSLCEEIINAYRDISAHCPIG